jgi:hypothetical protein
MDDQLKKVVDHYAARNMAVVILVADDGVGYNIEALQSVSRSSAGFIGEVWISAGATLAEAIQSAADNIA